MKSSSALFRLLNWVLNRDFRWPAAEKTTCAQFLIAQLFRSRLHSPQTVVFNRLSTRIDKLNESMLNPCRKQSLALVLRSCSHQSLLVYRPHPVSPRLHSLNHFPLIVNQLIIRFRDGAWLVDPPTLSGTS